MPTKHCTHFGRSRNKNYTLLMTSGGVFWTHLEFYCPDTPHAYCQDTPECTPQDKILFWLLKYLGERRKLIIVKYPKANFFLGHPVDNCICYIIDTIRNSLNLTSLQCKCTCCSCLLLWCMGMDFPEVLVCSQTKPSHSRSQGPLGLNPGPHRNIECLQFSR